MNILVLSELFYPHGSGAELATYLYTRLLSQAGLNISVVTNIFAEEEKISKKGNFTIYRLPLFNRSRSFARSLSFKYSILGRFDVLFSNFFRKMIRWADIVYVPRFWFSAIPLAKAYGKPVVAHLHDYIPICPLSIFYDVSKATACSSEGLLCQLKCIYTYEKAQGRDAKGALASIALNSTIGRCFPKLVHLSDAIICVSKLQSNIITKKDPLVRGKVNLVYNPLPGFLDIDIEGDDFGYFGGPDCLKGFHTLYQAMAHVNSTDRLFVRINATKFSNSSQQYARLLNRLGFVLYGKLRKSEYMRVYEQIRAVVVPSVWHEPWPYVVVEALIRGRFIVASNIGGIPEQIEGCKGVLLCEAGNPQNLAKAMEVANSLEREEILDLGFQNRETFLRRFDNETTIRRFIGVLEHLT